MSKVQHLLLKTTQNETVKRIEYAQKAWPTCLHFVCNVTIVNGSQLCERMPRDAFVYIIICELL